MRTQNRICLRVEELEGRLVPSSLAYSTNWSGYAVSASASAVTQVAGSWVVPAVSNTVSGYSSAWVGIDGYNSSTVEQIGTDSDYVNGVPRYYAWYEFYPQASVTIANMSVSPGDIISASVTVVGSHQFKVSITDGSQSFSIIQTVSHARQSSAEWIQEAPSSITGVLPLANFGTINVSQANATISGTTGPADNSWSGSALYQIDMVSSHGTLKATTSVLSDSGSPLTSSFSVTWVSSGSGGKGGGGHKSSNVPLPESPEMASLLSVAVTGLAASPQETAPAFIAIPSPTVTVTSPAMNPLPTLPTPSTVTATFGPFGWGTANAAGPRDDLADAPFGLDSANPGEEVADQSNRHEVPFPSDSPVPVAPLAASLTDGLPISQTGQTPTSLWGASPSPASLEGALNGGHEARDTTLAVLVLALALERTRASATYSRAGEKPTGWLDYGAC